MNFSLSLNIFKVFLLFVFFIYHFITLINKTNLIFFLWILYSLWNSFYIFWSSWSLFSSSLIFRCIWYRILFFHRDLYRKNIYVLIQFLFIFFCSYFVFTVTLSLDMCSFIISESHSFRTSGSFVTFIFLPVWSILMVLWSRSMCSFLVNDVYHFSLSFLDSIFYSASLCHVSSAMWSHNQLYILPFMDAPCSPDQKRAHFWGGYEFLSCHACCGCEFFDTLIG